MGNDGDGTVIPNTFYSGVSDKAKKFEEEMIKRAKAIGIERSGVSQFDAATYDIVLLYAYAMKQANVTGDAAKLAVERTAIRDALRAAKDFAALEGPISFGKMAMHSSRCILLKCKVVAGILSERIRRECEESDIALIDEGIRRGPRVFPHASILGFKSA